MLIKISIEKIPIFRIEEKETVCVITVMLLYVRRFSIRTFSYLYLIGCFISEKILTFV